MYGQLVSGSVLRCKWLQALSILLTFILLPATFQKVYDTIHVTEHFRGKVPENPWALPITATFHIGEKDSIEVAVDGLVMTPEASTQKAEQQVAALSF